jgi:hypothetical protein
LALYCARVVSSSIYKVITRGSNMKKITMLAIAALMLAGTFAGAAAPKKQTLGPVVGQGAAPMPMCSPGDPNCR